MQSTASTLDIRPTTSLLKALADGGFAGWTLNGALQAAVVTDPAVPLEPVSFEAFRTKPSEGGRPTVLTFVPDGSGGVSGVRISNIMFTRARAQR